ncbi:MAG: radical SAM protein [Bacteroidales bacterium]
MFDKFNREINYLRISVTDRCNLRCTYCMPAEGIQLISHDEILRFNEIVEFVKVAVRLGIDKVKITGGEPLVRKGIVELVKMISDIGGLKDFGMTTNGILLDKYATELANAGLQRVNISLDTMKPQKYNSITRMGDINMVMNGIKAAQSAGLTPIKINCVIEKSNLEKDALEVADFCKQNNLLIRFIKKMDLEKGEFWKVEGGEGGNCKICNRLRLTSNGKVKPCLFSDLEYDIRKLGIEKSIHQALDNKPLTGINSKINKFSIIGG